jgi:hypothetical protein
LDVAPPKVGGDFPIASGVGDAIANEEDSVFRFKEHMMRVSGWWLGWLVCRENPASASIPYATARKAQAPKKKQMRIARHAIMGGNQPAKYPIHRGVQS